MMSFWRFSFLYFFIFFIFPLFGVLCWGHSWCWNGVYQPNQINQQLVPNSRSSEFEVLPSSRSALNIYKNRNIFIYIYIYTRRKDGAKAPSLLDHLGHFDTKAWILEPGSLNLDFGTWNIECGCSSSRNMKNGPGTWTIDPGESLGALWYWSLYFRT